MKIKDCNSLFEYNQIDNYDDEYNQIHLIPQAWSVISRLSDEKRANLAMDNVLKYLYTDMGLKTHYNPTDRYDPANKSYYLHPAGSRENGGIFFHDGRYDRFVQNQLPWGCRVKSLFRIC